MKWQATVLVWVALLLYGCSSAPTRFYTLRTPPYAAKSNPTVLLLLLHMPEYVDRPQIVTRLTDHQVIVREHARWASPLKIELPLVIAAELNRSLDTVNFATLKSVEVVGTLSIDIQSLEISQIGGAYVQAHWSYSDSSSKAAKVGEIEGRSPASATIGDEKFADTLQKATEALSIELSKQLIASGSLR